MFAAFPAPHLTQKRARELCWRLHVHRRDFQVYFKLCRARVQVAGLVGGGLMLVLVFFSTQECNTSLRDRAVLSPLFPLLSLCPVSVERKAPITPSKHGSRTRDRPRVPSGGGRLCSDSVYGFRLGPVSGCDDPLSCPEEQFSNFIAHNSAHMAGELALRSELFMCRKTESE